MPKHMIIAACAITAALAFSAPAFAQGYDGLLAPQENYDAQTRKKGGGTATGGYSGVTTWEEEPAARGTPQPDNLYDYVTGTGATAQSAEDRRQAVIRQRQERTRALNEQNMKRAQEQREKWIKLREEQEQKRLEMEARAREGAMPYKRPQQ